MRLKISSHYSEQRFFPIAVLSCLTALALCQSSLSLYLDYHIRDFLLNNTRHISQEDHIVIVGIDDQVLDHFEEPLLLWHKYLAQVVDGAVNGGAKGIAVDMIPVKPVPRCMAESDQELIRVLKKCKEKGIPLRFGFRAGRYGEMPHKKFLFFSEEPGFLNIEPDKDDKIRRQRLYQKNDKGDVRYAISALLVNPLLNPEARERVRKINIDYRLSLPPVVSFKDVHKWSGYGMVTELRRSFENKYVLIGLTSPKSQDLHLTPADTGFGNYMPGVYIHALAAKTIVSGRLLKEAPPWIIWGLAVLTGVLSAMVFLILSPGRGLVIFLTLLIFICVSVYQAFTSYWMVSAVPLLLFLFIPAMIAGVYHFCLVHKQRHLLSDYFGRYVHPQIVENFLNNPSQNPLEAKSYESVSVMFTDIRGFSKICDENKETPDEIVGGLNRYFEEMAQSINEAGGYLNRTVGDGILAIFGAPNKIENHAWAAVTCGLDMIDRLNRLNEKGLFPTEKDSKIKIGIGIHTGGAIVGNVGGEKKLEYSIVGHTANLASRIESQTKEENATLLVSKATWTHVCKQVEAENDFEFQYIGRRALKNIKEKEELYKIFKKEKK